MLNSSVFLLHAKVTLVQCSDGRVRHRQLKTTSLYKKIIPVWNIKWVLMENSIVSNELCHHSLSFYSVLSFFALVIDLTEHCWLQQVRPAQLKTHMQNALFQIRKKRMTSLFFPIVAFTGCAAFTDKTLKHLLTAGRARTSCPHPALISKNLSVSEKQERSRVQQKNKRLIDTE